MDPQLSTTVAGAPVNVRDSGAKNPSSDGQGTPALAAYAAMRAVVGEASLPIPASLTRTAVGLWIMLDTPADEALWRAAFCGEGDTWRGLRVHLRCMEPRRPCITCGRHVPSGAAQCGQSDCAPRVVAGGAA